MKHVILLSGGIDSATCLGIAASQEKILNILALSVFYGQRHERELKSSRDLAAYYGVERHELDLSIVFKSAQNPLLRADADIPTGSYAEQQKKASGMVKTYIPFRNGLFLSAAASYAMSLYPSDDIFLWIGAHADDAAGDAYPDCSERFIMSMERALIFGTSGHVSIYAPFVRLNKAKIVDIGLKHKVPYKLTWSCYDGQNRPCGKCGTCIDRAKAFEANGITDPALAE